MQIRDMEKISLKELIRNSTRTQVDFYDFFQTRVLHAPKRTCKKIRGKYIVVAYFCCEIIDIISIYINLIFNSLYSIYVFLILVQFKNKIVSLQFNMFVHPIIIRWKQEND